MSEHHIYPSEAVFLVLWLSSPAVLLSWIVLTYFFVRQRVFRVGHVFRAFAGLFVSTVLIVGLGFFLWIGFPEMRIGSEPLYPSGGWLGLIPPLFLPPLVAAVIIVPFTVLWIREV